MYTSSTYSYMSFCQNYCNQAFAGSEARHYTNLEYAGISKGVIHFECTKDYESSDEKEIDQYVFTPYECLEIKNDFESHTYDEYVGYYVDGKFIDKYGDLLGSESNIKVLIVDQREYS